MNNKTEPAYAMGDVDLTEAEIEQLRQGQEVSDAPAPESPAQSSAEPPAQATPPPQDDDDAEAIVIGEDGRVRDKRGKFVPHRALHAEREEHKKTRSERDNLRVEHAKLSETLALLAQAYGIEDKGEAEPVANPSEKRPAVPEAPTLIDPQVDPLGALNQLRDLVAKGMTQQPSAVITPEHRELQSRVARMEAERAEAQTIGRFQREMAAAKTTDPEIDAKAQHVMQVQDGILAAQRPDLTPQQRQQMVLQGARTAIHEAHRAGRNPAAIIAEMAAKYNYQPKANGAAPAQAPAQNPQVAQRIENINRGQAASLSLSNAPGTTGSNTETANQLANLSEDEYAEKRGQMSRREYERRYLGRE